MNGLTSEHHDDGGKIQREYVDLAAAHPAQARHNLHFTLHGNYLHLIGDTGRPLFEAIMFRVVRPWEPFARVLQLVSKSFKDLPRFQRPRTQQPLELIGINVPSVDSSVIINFDLVRGPGPTHDAAGRYMDYFFTWGGITLRVQNGAVPGREDAITIFTG